MSHVTPRFLLPVALAINTVCVASPHSQLPRSAEKALVERFLGNKGKVSHIDDLRQLRIGEFDYLGVQAIFEVEDNFERYYQPLVVMRKSHADPSWFQAQFFSCGPNHIPQLFAMPQNEFLKALVPSHIK